MSRIHRAVQQPKTLPNIEKEGIDTSTINDFRNFRHSLSQDTLG